jgi:adiponectin receptor
MGTSYLGGLAIYTLRIPERFFPGKFDIIVIALTK